MSQIPAQIRDRFLDALSKEDEISQEQTEALRILMESGKKLKSTELEEVFLPDEGSVQ